MQQRPINQSTNEEIQPVPAMSVSTPLVSPVSLPSFMDAEPPASTTRKYRRRREVFLRLFLLGICLEGLYLALSPLLAGNDPVRDPLFDAWHAFLPWLALLNWRVWLPTQLWLSLAWCNPATLVGNANLLIVLLSLALFGVLLAAQVARVPRKMSLRSRRACARLILLFATLFALTMLLSPPHLDIFARDMLLSWLAGRMVTIYHVNPYIVASTAYPHDVATTLLALLPSDAIDLSYGPVGSSGPVGVDMSILISLLGQGQLANTLLSFRVAGLLFHLGNALLIWLILQRSKPELSIPALVLYAWNPLLLLLGVAQMHQELMTIFFILLAIYFLQRNAYALAWFSLLLAVLVNLVCLLVLPLFICMIMRKARLLVAGERALLWLTLLLHSLVVFVLAYLPYWNGWAWNGLATHMLVVFLPAHALNSLDAMLLVLPFPPPMLKLFNPVSWSGVLLGVVGLFWLFSFWLADTFDWCLRYASWLLLIFLILYPLYWPWYMLLPLALVLCSSHDKTLLLAIFLLMGALVSYYCWSRGLNWWGQAILALGLPSLLWGWCMFFITMSEVTLRKGEELAVARQPSVQRPRPPWLSRPPWSG